MNLFAGQQFRAFAGTATVLPDFDFETYSEAGLVYNPQLAKWEPPPGLNGQNRGLRACGTRAYAEHPSFRILSVAWDLKDGKGKRWWRPPELTDLFPATRAPHYSDIGELLEHVRRGGLIEAWNSGFEFQVWNYYCVPQLGWPILPLSQARCAMAKSKACGHPPGLADAGEVLHLAVQKDPKGKALIRKLTMPKKPTRKNPELRWTPQTAAKDFAALYAYNIRDIATEAEASIRLPDLTPFEQRVWTMDQRINMRGMQMDVDAIEDCIVIVEQIREKLHAELARLTNNQVMKSSEVAETLRWLGSRGLHLYDLDEETVTEQLERKDLPADIYRVIQIRAALAFGSVNKLYKMRSMTHRGRLYDQYSYAGAHTMLWNGHGVQVANLYSGIFKKPEEARKAREVIRTRCLEYVEYSYPGIPALEIIASYLRSLIIAAPGHRLISADFSAIQGVVTAALANECWVLDVFKTHGKIYEATASQITGKPLQFYLDYKKEHGKHHPDRQNYGKIPTLSAYFGAWIAGWKRFGADKVIGDDDAIKAVILQMRARIPNVVELWGGQTRNKFNRAPDGSYSPEYPEYYGLEGAAIKAILEPGQMHQHNGVRYQMYDGTLYCAGPSGGTMAYHEAKVKRSTREWARPWELEITYEGWNTNANKGKQNSWEEMKLYGGVLTQNAVARESREVQAHALLALDEHPSGNYNIVMHTHDENVAEVPFGRGSVAEYMDTMRSSLPSWARCLDGTPWPIKIPDAWECETYGKWED